MSELQEDFALPLDAFVRSIGIRKNTPLSIFIGAGASISSGVPSAQACIWEWKRHIFLTNNPGLEDQFSELSLPSTKETIQIWLDKQGQYPANEVPGEYGFYVQQCFPIKDDRNSFFREKIRTSRPHIGYQMLCQLAEADMIRYVWSTNFDGLPARAAADFDLVPLEIGIDSQTRLQGNPQRGELRCVSLHGDYRYDELRNTREEVRMQEKALSGSLVETARTTPLIVAGYSGRDRSVMTTLEAAYGSGGSGALYWCGVSDQDPPAHVVALIRHARSHGREAHYVRTEGFDDLMIRLALHCLKDKHLEAAQHRISALAPSGSLDRKPFNVPAPSTATLIKSNAFEIECPNEVFRFDLKEWPREKVWTALREAAGNRPLVCVPFGTVSALGTIEDIRDAFGDNLTGPIERTPISPAELGREEGAIVSLMQQALVRSMAEQAGLRTDGNRVLWRPTEFRTERHGTTYYRVHDAVEISLRLIGVTQYLVLMPTLRVFDQTGTKPSVESIKAIKLKILSSQYNNIFNKAVNRWRKELFGEKPVQVFQFPRGSGSPFKFRVRRSPIFAAIGTPTPDRNSMSLQQFPVVTKHMGLQLGEPSLVFSNRDGTDKVRDTHPIRGVLRNRPFDYPLTMRGLSSRIRVGVVCPAAENESLSRYLRSIDTTHIPMETERDYLPEYPGFGMAYGLPVEFPVPDSPGWITCANVTGSDSRQGSRQVANLITQGIDQLGAAYAPQVVLIFFPDRWEAFRGYKSKEERFDVHDFVKAYCVQRGIPTQFLNQDTLSYGSQCRVWWWLSLALYAKGMRTPWLLDNLAEDTAFVGLGFSIDQGAERGEQVVLGCSHIYSTRGEGLQYRLSKVEEPVIRRGNPFMSLDDARRIGETVRQLFFDARGTLPKRVVLHKRTPFLRDEREGLRDGMSGVECLEMVEIQIDHALRYVASARRPNGTFDEDNYPVRRGTVMKLDDFTALLWTHGATSALRPGLRYYQGKRRIPAPLTIRRHTGITSLQELAGEILGLSKMDWNTFDLYRKLPATLQSSNKIAKIGALLQRFGTESYDYRLFM